MTVIIDYQMGNLRSVQKAIQRVGGDATISSDPNVIATAERLVLPGVGGFGDAMREIRRRDLVRPIRDYIDGGRPFLGICLGLQLLFDVGEENGTHEGLGVIPGRVVRFEPRPDRKVPHMGWNQVSPRGDHPMIADVAEGEYFYFVHSYYVEPDDDSVTSLVCDYQQPFTAAIGRDNVFATQFHPEKSQDAGMKLLSGFLNTPILA